MKLRGKIVHGVGEKRQNRSRVTIKIDLFLEGSEVEGLDPVDSLLYEGILLEDQLVDYVVIIPPATVAGKEYVRDGIDMDTLICEYSKTCVETKAGFPWLK